MREVNISLINSFFFGYLKNSILKHILDVHNYSRTNIFLHFITIISKIPVHRCKRNKIEITKMIKIIQLVMSHNILYYLMKNFFMFYLRLSQINAVSFFPQLCIFLPLPFDLIFSLILSFDERM